MDVRQLRHFAAIADTLHFGRAAERLGMTQPPLSQSIQALERELGTALFDRSKRSVALSAFGAHWLPEVREALAGIDALPATARRLRDGEAGSLELSFVSTADYSVLPELVRRYAALYPAVEIRLTEATTDIQVEALLAGRGHAGIIVGVAEGGVPEALGYRRLVSEPLVAAVPEGWVTSGRIAVVNGRVRGDALLRAPLIIFPRRVAPVFHDLVIAYLSGHGAMPHIAQEAIQMQTIVSLVSADMGVALVPESLRNLPRPGVRYMDLADATPPMLETGIAWRRADSAPTLAHFLEIAAEVVER